MFLNGTNSLVIKNKGDSDTSRLNDVLLQFFHSVVKPSKNLNDGDFSVVDDVSLHRLRQFDKLVCLMIIYHP